MAKLVKLPKGREFTFRPTPRGGMAAKYDWDQWFDGQTWMLEQSIGEKDKTGAVVKVSDKKDYEIATVWMPSKLKMAGRKRYKVVQVSRVDANGDKLQDAVILKARDMTQEEREAEDLLRAEEEAKRVEARMRKKLKDQEMSEQEEEAA